MWVNLAHFSTRITWRLEGFWSPRGLKKDWKEGELPRPPVGRPAPHEGPEQAGGGRRRRELRGEGGGERKEGEGGWRRRRRRRRGGGGEGVGDEIVHECPSRWLNADCSPSQSPNQWQSSKSILDSWCRLCWQVDRDRFSTVQLLSGVYMTSWLSQIVPSKKHCLQHLTCHAPGKAKR